MSNKVLETDKEKYVFEFIETLDIKTRNIDDLYKEKVRSYIKRKNGLVKSLIDLGYNLNDACNIKFCDFKIDPKKNYKSGVYLWVINNEIKYIGETKDLLKRFNSGYGRITPRNIAKGGQSTNCKMNLIALNNKNNKIDIYFYETKKYKEVEADLLEHNKKYNKWNLYNVQHNK